MRGISTSRIHCRQVVCRVHAQPGTSVYDMLKCNSNTLHTHELPTLCFVGEYVSSHGSAVALAATVALCLPRDKALTTVHGELIE